MSEVRVYRYPCTFVHITKADEIRTYQGYGTRTYTCTLRHPNAPEVAQMRAEIAAGQTKKATAAAHQITTWRLNNLFAKFPEDKAESP